MFAPFVITSYGTISGYGNKNSEFRKNLEEGLIAVKDTDLFDNSSYVHKAASFISNFNPKQSLDLKRVGFYDRITLYTMQAIQNLKTDFSDSASFFGLDSNEISIILGTFGPIKSISDFDMKIREDPRSVNPSDFPNLVACAALGYASIRYKITGCNITLANGSTSSLDALGLAAIKLKNDPLRCKVVLAGGAEELSIQYALMMQNRAKHFRVLNPVLGEGAVLFGCEKRENAEKRKAKIFAEVIGYSTCFCPDIKEALTYNKNILQQIVSENVLNSIACIYNDDIQQELLRTIFKNDIPVRQISHKLGYLNSVTGAFQLAEIIISAGIKPNEVVLIVNHDLSGNCSLLLVKKNSFVEQ